MTTKPHDQTGVRGRKRRDSTTPVYVISVAADLTGVHAQTLRNYERRGLLTPARSQGGNRRYSDADLTRIRRITELTDDGLPLAGVRRILDLERRLAEITPPVTALLTRRAAQLPHAARSAHLEGQPGPPPPPPRPPAR
ncbi:MAG: MerR family transcriptional regulator [Ilumatobacter sp.]|uniref:MerR family transcriptional regulator n=1 Tax=Ilumatobacter sp. TaxID=1967498 RepID=UPI003C745674